ncbi:hypothetical protein HanPSC8_Chr16g0706331 [Helianthus annuus]|nr:hypothetical protein HanPSC8_Chr16g0706331 [Helianthus annuus]
MVVHLLTHQTTFQTIKRHDLAASRRLSLPILPNASGTGMSIL